MVLPKHNHSGEWASCFPDTTIQVQSALDSLLACSLKPAPDPTAQPELPAPAPLGISDRSKLPPTACSPRSWLTWGSFNALW